MSDSGTAVRSGYLADLYPEIKALLDQGKPVCISFRGTSMSPTLRGGKDSVILVRPEGKLRRYDIPLYRRDNGEFVLHRIVSVNADGSYSCCGDHQFSPEDGIREDQFIAVADQRLRRGRQISLRSFGQRFWARCWCLFLRPARRVVLTAAGAFRKLFPRH